LIPLIVIERGEERRRQLIAALIEQGAFFDSGAGQAYRACPAVCFIGRNFDQFVALEGAE
jgi:hypothetical protein